MSAWTSASWNLTANETLGVEDSVVGVHGDLVLGGITDETLGVGEGHEGRGGAVTLVVGDDFDPVITEDTHTGVGGSQIDTDSGGHFECEGVVSVSDKRKGNS